MRPGPSGRAAPAAARPPIAEPPPAAATGGLVSRFEAARGATTGGGAPKGIVVDAVVGGPGAALPAPGNAGADCVLGSTRAAAMPGSAALWLPTLAAGTDGGGAEFQAASVYDAAGGSCSDDC